MTISVAHRIPGEDVLIGLVRAEAIASDNYPDRFDELLEHVLRRGDLTDEMEKRRKSSRDMLRRGQYRPTGRGKPASEYLLRAAADGSFPRINGPVDVCNLVSLTHVIPISLWDIERSGRNRFIFRLGRAGEMFTFNEGGQQIGLQDLVVGCRVRESDDSEGEPIVNPVKDGLATKTTSSTTRVAASVYAPLSAMTATELERICGLAGRLRSRRRGLFDVHFARYRGSSLKTSLEKVLRTVLLLLSLLSMAACRHDPGPSLQDVRAETAPDKESWDVHYEVTETSTVDAPSKPRIAIDARYMAVYDTPDSTYTLMSGDSTRPRLKAVFFDEAGDTSATLHANRLILHEAERRFEARGDVFVVSTDHKTLETERLDWFEDDREIRTPAFVRIRTDKERVQGYDLVADENLDSYTLKRMTGQVTVEDEEE